MKVSGFTTLVMAGNGNTHRRIHYQAELAKNLGFLLRYGFRHKQADRETDELTMVNAPILKVMLGSRDAVENKKQDEITSARDYSASRKSISECFILLDEFISFASYFKNDMVFE